MSTETSIIAEIIDLIELKKALSELELKYERVKSVEDSAGITHKVEVAIKDPNGRVIGLEKNKDGSYQFVSDSKGLTRQQLKQQADFINRIKQRYAYNKIIKELKGQGYIIAQEQKVENNTIKLVARKWS